MRAAGRGRPARPHTRARPGTPAASRRTRGSARSARSPSGGGLQARTGHVAEPERPRAAGLHEPALAGHVALEQADDHRGDVLRGDDAKAGALELVADGLDHRRLGEAGADRVDADAVGREPGAERAHEADDGVLVGGVERVERHSGQPGQGGGGDDGAPVALLAQRAEDGVRAEDDAVEVDAHRPAVLGEVEVLADAAAGGDAGVEEGEVEAAGELVCALDHGAVGVEVGHVDGDEVTAELLRELGAAVLVEIGHDHLGAGLGERAAGGAPQTARAAGDEGDLVAQVFHGARVYGSLVGDDFVPFRIAVPAAELEDLRARLHRTRWPERDTVDGWEQGVPLAYAQDLCRYWADEYDWRATERRLNALPQFRTSIDGLGIHFLHVRSPEPGALPLVLTHGWPGSVVEFLTVLGPLTDHAAQGGSAADAFDVVCPSLPGFGFSDMPSRGGWGIERIADAWAALMARLGYERYGAQAATGGRRSAPSSGSATVRTSPASTSPRRSRRPIRPRSTSSPGASARRFRHWSTRPNGTPCTRRSTRGRRPSGTRSSTRPRRCARGSSRSSGSGPTAMGTWSECSRATSCSTT